MTDPHTVRLLASGEDEYCWAAFELVPGDDLAMVLARHRRLGTEAVKHVVRQVAESLAEAHRVGIVHRDLKPENICVFDGADGPLTVKVLDFGIARGSDAGPSVTATGDVIGTPRYMAPEQLRGESVSASADVYALGLVAFELLAGREALPSGGIMEQVSRFTDNFRLELPDPTEEEAQLLSLIRRMTAADPRRRLSSMDAVIATLDGPRPRTQRAARASNSRSWGAVALLAMVFTIPTVLMLWTEDDVAPPVAVSRSNPLVVPPPPDPAPPELEEPAPKPAPKGELPSWCSRGPMTGLAYIEDMGREVAVIATDAFDATKDPMVLALLRRGHEYLGLRDILADENVLIVFPDSKPPNNFGVTWNPTHQAWYWAGIQGAALQFCVPEDAPLFVFGHGIGGRMVDLFAREYPDKLTAVAVSALRYEKKYAELGGVPYLDFSHRKDGFTPYQGGKSLTGDGPFNSVAERFDHLRRQYSCSGDGEVVFEQGTSTCRRFECDKLLQLCDIDGGQYWKADVSNAIYLDGAGTSEHVPHAQILWDFFMRARELGSWCFWPDRDRLGDRLMINCSADSARSCDDTPRDQR